eukprot:473063-Pyramimonas_sp.AAC.1
MRSTEEWESMWYLDAGYMAWCDSEALDDLHERAEGKATKLESQFARSRAQQRRGIVREVVRAGTGRARQCAEPPVSWRPLPPRPGRAPPGPSELIEQMLQDWGRIWDPRGSERRPLENSEDVFP